MYTIYNLHMYSNIVKYFVYIIQIILNKAILITKIITNILIPKDTYSNTSIINN